MLELTRTNDPVFLSWLTAALADKGIVADILDTHTSIMEGSIPAIPRRVMVADKDIGPARLVLAEGERLARGEGLSAITKDALLGGRVEFYQPAKGYRAAIDPVFLAAAVPAGAGERVLDAGAGAGAAALCLAARVPGVTVTALEFQPFLAALARKNVEANGMAGRISVLDGDILMPPAAIKPGSYHHVMANPPYLDPARCRPPPDPVRAAATHEGAAGLADWVYFCCRMAAANGTVTIIHRAEREDELLAAFGEKETGPAAITIFPLLAGEGKAAKRIIVQARKGSSAPPRRSSGMVLHDAGGGYTAQAKAVLAEAGGLSLYDARRLALAPDAI
jgi:tRNA1(Val) A37 N6-methylase TrmN6